MKGVIVMTGETFGSGHAVNDVNAAQARELLGLVQQTQLSAAPSLSPTWAPYAIFCALGSTYPLLSYAFTQAGLGVVIPTIVFFVWIIAGALILGLTMRQAIKRQARGFGQRWGLLMAGWGVLFGAANIASNAALEGRISVWSMVGISALFALLAIIGPLMELRILRAGGKLVTAEKLVLAEELGHV